MNEPIEDVQQCLDMNCCDSFTGKRLQGVNSSVLQTTREKAHVDVQLPIVKFTVVRSSEDHLHTLYSTYEVLQILQLFQHAFKKR